MASIDTLQGMPAFDAGLLRQRLPECAQIDFEVRDTEIQPADSAVPEIMVKLTFSGLVAEVRLRSVPMSTEELIDIGFAAQFQCLAPAAVSGWWRAPNGDSRSYRRNSLGVRGADNRQGSRLQAYEPTPTEAAMLARMGAIDADGLLVLKPPAGSTSWGNVQLNDGRVAIAAEPLKAGDTVVWSGGQVRKVRLTDIDEDPGLRATVAGPWPPVPRVKPVVRLDPVKAKRATAALGTLLNIIDRKPGDDDGR
jgi:hypothetical protein